MYSIVNARVLKGGSCERYGTGCGEINHLLLAGGVLDRQYLA
jgi:hypothetical protein